MFPSAHAGATCRSMLDSIRSPLDLELVDDVISMKQFVADEAEGVAIAAVVQSEHVKRPIIDVLPKSCIQSQCRSSKYIKYFIISRNNYFCRFSSLQ